MVIDSGGRGSVLVDKYLQSKFVRKVISVPGNDLMQINTTKKVLTFPNLKTTSIPEILAICREEKVTLVDVAQDNAIEAGLVDELIKIGIPAIGPTKLAGQIEWDKAWAREFGQRHHLPQPIFKICNSQKEGINFLKSQPDQSWFIKAAGLAEGKGVLPASNNMQAIKMVREMKRFGKSGKKFLIEKWLKSENGQNAEEFSLFIISDGKNYQIIGSAQDHKRVNNFDEGENTGGMGCTSSPSVLTPSLIKEIDTKILQPTINGLKIETRPYKGILYLGGILIKENGKISPYVIEFNSRWGDPEAQVILPGIKNDLFGLNMALLEGKINQIKILTDNKIRVAVAGVSRGYPVNYENVKGKQIFGLDQINKIKGVKLYGAGVKIINNKFLVNGGRLFYIVGEGKTVIEARQKAYAAISLIHIDNNNLHYRIDIGWRDVQRLQKVYLK